MSGGGSRSVRRAFEVLSDQGLSGLTQRSLRWGYQRFGVEQLDFPLLDPDVADSTNLSLPEPTGRVLPGSTLRIAWVTTPPGAGSGGHTTMFRMIEGLEAAGHHCTVVLYDRYGGRVEQQRDTIRRAWPWVRADVRPITDGLGGFDAVVATSWQTAHVVASRTLTQPCRRLYLVQDFEPFFYARGSEYALAEDSYRFGFRMVSIGHMVADLLRERFGLEAEVAEFGCDTSVYRLTNRGPRNGVAFYAKPGTARRGFRLAELALREFHERRPDQVIHTYGTHGAQVDFPVEHHGTLTPDQLNELYNSCVAGVAMSFTNISLIAEELLAAGAIPVVNDSPYARADLDNPWVRWATPTPGAIAEQLCAAVDVTDVRATAAKAARSVRPDEWAPAQRTVLEVVEDEVLRPE